MAKQSSMMRKLMIMVLALAVVLSYSMLPMNQSYAASAKKPAKVKSLKATAVSSSSVKLTWKKAKNAKKYQIYVSTKKTKGFKKVATVKKSKKTYTVTKLSGKALKANTKYYFKVRAINGKKKGKFSAVKAATTKKAAAPAPANEVLIDARTPEVYAGWAVDGNSKGGHLKGAVNIAAQWVDMADLWWAHDSEKKSLDDAIAMEIEANGISKSDKITVYDTNDKDAAKVAGYLKGKGYTNVATVNKKSEIEASSDLVSYANYELNVPAEVVKNISDYKLGKAELTDAAKQIVGNADKGSIKLLHAEYASSGRYTDDGYKMDNPIDWTDGTSYYEAGHVPGAVPISTDDFEPETEPRNNEFVTQDGVFYGWNRSKGETFKQSDWLTNYAWIGSYMLRSDEELIALAGKYGINKGDVVVVAGYEPMATTRIAVILKYLGVEKVYVMGAAYNEWLINGYDRETNVVNEPVAGTDITSVANPDVIDTQDEVAAKLTDSSWQVVDTRTADEYNGLDTGYNYHDIAGRIENTILSESGVGYSSSMYYYRNPDSSMRSENVLKAKWDKEGVKYGDKKLSFFCGSGWRASEEVWDAWVLGYNDAALYSDGWQGWSNAGRPFIDKDGKVLKLNAEEAALVNDVNIKFNYVTAENLVKDIASGSPEYTVIDVRQAVDESGQNMGSYAESHIVTAASGPVVSNDYKTLSYSEAAANLKAAGVSADSGKKYVMVCYYGGEVAERAVTIAAEYMGVPVENLYILKDGQWAMDPDWSFMADDPYEAPEYLVSVGTSKGGVAYNGVTVDQLKTDMNGSHKVYKIIDVRSADSYKEGHIDGAVSAPVSTGDDAVDKANIQKVFNEYGSGAVYCLICYSGNAYADLGQNLLIGFGVPEGNIVRLIGGQGAWTE